MMHHPLPFSLDQWSPSWPDLSTLAKPDPSWFAYPSNPYPPRRRPYFRVASPTRALHPHSSRTRAHPHAPPLRAQVAPLPALPISLSIPGFEPSTVSPSDPGSPMSTAAPPTPAPEFLHVVCNAPLLAPKPLPYRPPAFLDNFELPDPDEDLSHPPYTRSSAKRKRTQDGQDDSTPISSLSKRRATQSVLRGLNGVRSHRRFSK